MAGTMRKQELQEVNSQVRFMFPCVVVIYLYCIYHVPLLLIFEWLSNFFFFQGLDVIESTNLKYFSKEMTAEFYALKGTFLAQIGR